MLDIKFIRENPDKVKEGCKKKNADCDVDKVLELDEKRRELVQKIEGLRSEQHKLGKADIEKAKGLKLAILSDAPRIQAWLRLAAMGLHQEFDVVVTFDDVKRKKPAPEPFLLALKKLKVKPREAVMVGDSPQRDIATAQRLGMTTVLAGYGSARFLSSKKTAMQAKSRAKPDFVIKDVRSLLRVVSE